MALYLGSSEKLKINLDGINYYLSVFSDPPITNGIRLVTSDECVLVDAKGRYITFDPEE